MKIIAHQIDLFASYYFDKHDKFILNLGEKKRESKDPNEEILEYKAKDLELFYSINRNNFYLKKITREGRYCDRYFIINETKNLLFIPIFNKKANIITYTCSEHENFEILKEFRFYRSDNYIISTDHITMHEIIIGQKAPEKHKIDHINSVTIDNRRKNLRYLNDSQNMYNRNFQTNNTSGFTGVSWCKRLKKWQSYININNKKLHIGYFHDKIEAVKSRDSFAVTNGLNVKLNQINGENVLSEEEIESAKNNTEKHIEKENKISAYIYQKQNKFCFMKNYTKYFDTKEMGDNFLNEFKIAFCEIQALEKCDLEFDENKNKWKFKITFSKIYKEINSAIEMRDKMLDFIEKFEQNQKEQLEKKIEENRNIEGVAVLKAYDGKGYYGKEKEYVDVKVDDDFWKIYIHYSISLDKDGYPVLTKNRKKTRLHIEIYKNKYPIEYENKENKTIDHIDRDKLDARVLQLKLADPNEQAHNKKITREILVSYKGVNLSASGKYYAEIRYKNKRVTSERFEYIEDAARKYNEMQKQYYPEYSEQYVGETKTNAKDIYENPNIELINSIKTIIEIKVLFKINSWKTNTPIYKMKVENLDEYRNWAIQECKKTLYP